MPARFLGSFPDPGQLPLRPGRVFLCFGRSNVGKSSFINAWLKSPLARTSQTPGRTLLLNLFEDEKGTLLVDTPGYGFAKHAKTERDRLEDLLFQTLNALKDRLDGVLLVTDSNVGPTSLDKEAWDFLTTEEVPTLIVANKADRLNQKETHASKKKYEAAFGQDIPLFFVSAEKGTGLPALRNAIEKGIPTPKAPQKPDEIVLESDLSLDDPAN